MDIASIVTMIAVFIGLVFFVFCASYFLNIPWWACVLFLMIAFNIIISLDIKNKRNQS